MRLGLGVTVAPQTRQGHGKLQWPRTWVWMTGSLGVGLRQVMIVKAVISKIQLRRQLYYVKEFAKINVFRFCNTKTID
jgi:hypothetical protein